MSSHDLGSRFAGARCPAVAALGALLIAGCGASSASPIGTTSPASGTNLTRVAAIEKVLRDHPDSADSPMIEFFDVSDPGPQRLFQVGCFSDGGCETSWLCDHDSKGRVPCDEALPRLKSAGFRGLTTQGDPDHWLLDGSFHEGALLTEYVFLNELGASSGYQLAWRPIPFGRSSPPLQPLRG